jgi:hypothetical protein
MSPGRRSTGATCQGRPRRHCPVELKCRRHAGRGRWGAARLWARAHVLRSPPPPPEWASGRSAPARRPLGRTLLSRRDMRPAKPILREGWRSDRCPSTSSITARTGPTPTPCRGAHGGECCRRGGSGSKWSGSRNDDLRARSPRVGGLEACSPPAGDVGSPGEEGLGALQDVSSRFKFSSLCFFRLVC